jgi:hypothetical protein
LLELELELELEEVDCEDELEVFEDTEDRLLLMEEEVEEV